MKITDAELKSIIRRTLGVVTAIALIITIIPIPAQADHQYVRRTIPAYIQSDPEPDNMECLFTEDMPVAYVNVENFLNRIYAAEFSTHSLGDGVYRISNMYGDMIINTRENTIHFDTFEQTIYRDDDPTDVELKNYSKSTSFEYLSDVSTLDMNLSNYGIDIIEDQGRVYMPINTIPILLPIHIVAVYMPKMRYLLIRHPVHRMLT